MKFVLGGAMTNSVNATNMSIDNLRVYGSRAINKKKLMLYINKTSQTTSQKLPTM